MTPAEMVGHRVATVRERLGMSQAQLGEELGKLLEKPWPRQTVSHAEKGKRAFTAAEIVALAVTLDVSVASLFTAPLGMARLEMPAGQSISRADLEGLGLSAAQAGNEDWQAVVRAFDAGKDQLSTTLGRAMELTQEWSAADRQRSADVSELYEQLLAAMETTSHPFRADEND